MESLLKEHGYKQRGKRWLSPTSESDLAGVVVLDDGRVFSHHASDPLNNGHSHDAFDIFRILDHGGDTKAAVKAAAAGLGIATTTGASAQKVPEPLALDYHVNQPTPDPVMLYGLAGDVGREAAETGPASALARVGLPSELEWEKAARGGLPDAVFSWDDTPDPNRANYGDSGIGDTSAVGCFPANGFGLYDMIGNAWEWTRSLWGKTGDSWTGPDFAYPYEPDDPKRENLDAGNHVWRVVRGGAWDFYSGFARCAYRGWNRPDYRNDDISFRVVLRSTAVP